MEDIRRTRSSGSTEQNSHELTVTKAASTGAPCSIPGLLHKHYSFKPNIFKGTNEYLNKLVSDSRTFSWDVFLLLFFWSNFHMRVFLSSYILFCYVFCYLFESFYSQGEAKRS